MDTLLGIDIGTSACKAVAMEATGGLLAWATRAIPLQRPWAGCAEQRPEDWLEAACGAIRACLEKGGIRPESVLALSLTGPAHCVALLDGAGEPLRPTIHWSDERSAQQTEHLEREAGRELWAITGQRLHPSCTLPQLYWLREREPDIWLSLRRILPIKDYVRFRLTGRISTDPYDAAGTMLYDLSAGQWSGAICERLGLAKEALPPIEPAAALGGRLMEAAARQTGLLAGTPVAVGSGDSAVEAFGAGALRPGDCTITLGTSANVNIVTREPVPSRAAMAYPFLVDGHGLSVMATNSGASSLRWFCESFWPSGMKGDPVVAERELLERAQAIPPGSEGLIFHPYLVGERSPYWDPTLRGSFLGITGRHGLGHFARAVLEGVAYSLRDCMEAAEEAVLPVRRSVLLGGGSLHPVWRNIVRDALGRPLARPAVADASCGAALLAGLAAGAFETWEAAAGARPGDAEMLEPDAQAHAAYSRGFETYRKAAALLREQDANRFPNPTVEGGRLERCRPPLAEHYDS